jgi:hypothetical protein
VQSGLCEVHALLLSYFIEHLIVHQSNCLRCVIPEKIPLEVIIHACTYDTVPRSTKLVNELWWMFLQGYMPAMPSTHAAAVLLWGRGQLPSSTHCLRSALQRTPSAIPHSANPVQTSTNAKWP